MTDSWWLKFKRAQHHLAEIRQAIRAYSKADPYAIRRVRSPKGAGNVWRYRIFFRPLDPMIVMMIGDFVHNLRSALDHIAVACSERKHRKSASFPLAAKDPFVLDATGQFVSSDGDARRSYLRAIRGMSWSVRAMIAECQPYMRQAESDVFRILGVLDNADKHRQLISVEPGLRGGVTRASVRGVKTRGRTFHPYEFYSHGTQVYTITLRADHSMKHSDVRVESKGTISAGVNLAGLDTHKKELSFPLARTMLRTLRDVRFTLGQFEKQVISRH